MQRAPALKTPPLVHRVIVRSARGNVRDLVCVKNIICGICTFGFPLLLEAIRGLVVLLVAVVTLVSCFIRRVSITC